MHEEFMREAIALSDEGMSRNCGGPFGAVIVKDNKIIGRGFNQVLSSNDPTAHAEMVAIREASSHENNFDLSGCEIYASCEPCPMCLSAIYWARIKKIYYAMLQADAKSIGFDDVMIYEQLSLQPHERPIPSENLLRDEGVVIFEKWMEKTDKRMY